jgi:hypothetical protein
VGYDAMVYELYTLLYGTGKSRDEVRTRTVVGPHLFTSRGTYKPTASNARPSSPFLEGKG